MTQLALFAPPALPVQLAIAFPSTTPKGSTMTTTPPRRPRRFRALLERITTPRRRFGGRHRPFAAAGHRDGGRVGSATTLEARTAPPVATLATATVPEAVAVAPFDLPSGAPDATWKASSTAGSLGAGSIPAAGEFAPGVSATREYAAVPPSRPALQGPPLARTTDPAAAHEAAARAPSSTTDVTPDDWRTIRLALQRAVVEHTAHDRWPAAEAAQRTLDKVADR